MIKKMIVVLFIIVCFFGIHLLYNRYYKYHEFSKETREWMLWYDSLSEDDRLAISYFPQELSEAIENGYKYKAYKE